MVAAALAGPSVRAEFEVGSALPGVSLPAVDGSRVEMQVANGALALKMGANEVKPAAVVVHLLQPDCLQCRAQLTELQTLHDRFQSRGVVVLGIAHRGTLQDAQKLGRDLAISFPLLHGPGSQIATQFAAGDTLGIADHAGIIRFAQVGFGQGDEALWVAALENLLASEPVAKAGVERARLAAGDRFPAVELPSLVDAKPMALIGKDGRLTFRDGAGKETPVKGAVGFFSRY